MKTTYILVLSLVLLVFSCSEEIKPTPYNYTTIFTGQNSKTWKLKFAEETLNGDVTETFNIACGTDDKYIFYADAERSYEAVNGSRNCQNQGDYGVIRTSWSFNNASATLAMLLPFFTTEGSIPLIVREVKGNKMELEYFFNEENTQSYRLHFDATDED